MTSAAKHIIRIIRLIENEKSLKKIAAFLNVSKDLLNRQHPLLLMEMLEAADKDKMIKVHHLGMEMKDRFKKKSGQKR